MLRNLSKHALLLLTLFVAIIILPISGYANDFVAIDDSSILAAPDSVIPKMTGIKSTKKKGNSRIWNLRDVDIQNVISEVSRETGKNFIVDPRVQGNLTLVSSSPMSPDEIYPVFLSALQILGFSAVPSGAAIKILPNVNARELNSPVVSNLPAKPGDKLIVQVIPIKYVSAQQLVPILRPLLPQWANISAYAPSNTLIVSGHARNLQRIVKIVKRVDHAYNKIDIIPLRNALAQDVVKTIKALEPKQRRGGNQVVTIAADSRSNSVLIGGGKSERLRIRVIITELDIASPSGASGNTQVIYLHFRNAKDMVPILAGIARGTYGAKVGITIGTRTESEIEKKVPQRGSENQTSSYQTGPTPQTAESGTAQTSDEESRVQIIAEPNTNSVIINAPPTLMRTLKSVISQLDIRPAQVLVEALIAEISETDSEQLGIQWGSIVSDALTDNGGGDGNGLVDAGLKFQSGVGIIRKGTDFRNFQMVIRALAKNNKADILSTPSLVVLDNHLAKILVGKQVSIQQSQYPNNAGGSAGATPFTTFGREDVALHLYVTPQISHANAVQLTLDQGNDTLENPNDPTTFPIVNKSRLSTTVLVQSGDVLVLGGLIQNQLQDGEEKLPILGDIPILGRFFTVKTKSREKKNLMIFLRPIILHNDKDNIRVTDTKYDFMRDEQLKWLRKRPYNKNNKDYILPQLTKPLKIPVPFTTPPDKIV